MTGRTMTVAVWSALAALALAVLGVGVWQLGWFVEEKNVDKRTEINNRSTARQSALQEEIVDKYRDVRNIDVQLGDASDEQRPALIAQRRAITNQMCDAWFQTTDSALLPDSIHMFLQGECS